MNTTITCYPHNVTGGTSIEPNSGRIIGKAMRSGNPVVGAVRLGGVASIPNHCAIAHSAALNVSPPA